VPGGTAWALTKVLAYLAVIGFAIAAWGVFKQYSWWETAAVASGIAGLVAVVPHWPIATIEASIS